MSEHAITPVGGGVGAAIGVDVAATLGAVFGVAVGDVDGPIYTRGELVPPGDERPIVRCPKLSVFSTLPRRR